MGEGKAISGPAGVRCDLCGGADFEELLQAPEIALGLGGRFTVLVCRHCGLGRTDPIPEDIGAWYATGYWNHQWPSDPAHELSARLMRTGAVAPGGRVARLLARTLVPVADVGPPMAPGARLLDVGAGTGHAVHAFAAAGLDARGVEPSADGVAVGRAHGVEGLRVGTLDDVPEADGPFDLVRFWHVLEHVPSPVAALRRAHALLAPGGRLVIGVPNLAAVGRRVFGAAWGGLDVPRHTHHFTPASLRRALLATGFRAERIHTVAVMGVLPGSVALLRGLQTGRVPRVRPAVQVASYPVELLLAAVGSGDGLMAVAVAEPTGASPSGRTGRGPAGSA